jgi:hypothetical protein
LEIKDEIQHPSKFFCYEVKRREAAIKNSYKCMGLKITIFSENKHYRKTKEL